MVKLIILHHYTIHCCVFSAPSACQFHTYSNAPSHGFLVHVSKEPTNHPFSPAPAECCFISASATQPPHVVPGAPLSLLPLQYHAMNAHTCPVCIFSEPTVSSLRGVEAAGAVIVTFQRPPCLARPPCLSWLLWI